MLMRKLNMYSADNRTGSMLNAARAFFFIKLVPTVMRQTVRFPPVAGFRAASATADRA
jgi:hypothetical protein